MTDTTKVPPATFHQLTHGAATLPGLVNDGV